MSRRIRIPRDLGEAISMENVLSLMVVLFVLRMLFFIPLVNLDRMSLVKAQTDEYWPKLSDYLMTHGDSLAPASYNSSFGFDGNRILISESGQGDIRYIESLNLDGTITVVEHRMGAGRFDAMVVKGHSSVVGFSFGALRWSSGEQVWFTTNDSADYGNRPESVAMKKRFRDWTQKARGF